jgi:hypothetical protein
MISSDRKDVTIMRLVKTLVTSGAEFIGSTISAPRGGTRVQVISVHYGFHQYPEKLISPFTATQRGSA